MNSFLKDLTGFAGKRIDANNEQLEALLGEPEEVLSKLDDEAKANLQEAVGKEAAYIIGLGDGIRLVCLIAEKEKRHIFED